MKYIFKNLISFFRDSKLVAVLAVISIFVSAVVINFSYGIYQNYNAVIKNDVQDGELIMSMLFINEGDNEGDNEGEYVSKKMFMDCIEEYAGYSQKLYEKTSVIGAHGMIDNCSYEFRFGVRDGEISISDDYVENSKNSGMISDKYWGDTDERVGNQVALCYNFHKYNESHPYLESIMKDENTLVIGGKEYEIIGYQSWVPDGALIPIMSIDDATCMSDALIMFDRGITKTTYDRIANTFKSKLGDLVYVAELPTLDRDSYYTYRTVIMIAGMTALISALNFMILYKYILDKRQKKTAIYRLCGLTRGMVSFYNLVECICITFPVYILGVIMYDRLLLPILEKYFTQMHDAYTNKLYLILFAIYAGISLVVCLITILVNNHRKILLQIKG